MVFPTIFHNSYYIYKTVVQPFVLYSLITQLANEYVSLEKKINSTFPSMVEMEHQKNSKLYCSIGSQMMINYFVDNDFNLWKDTVQI